jgi:hypothetical protein
MSRQWEMAFLDTAAKVRKFLPGADGQAGRVAAGWLYEGAVDIWVPLSHVRRSLTFAKHQRGQRRDLVLTCLARWEYQQFVDTSLTKVAAALDQL